MVLGVGLGIVGYNKLQPTYTERAIQFVERFSGQPAPPGCSWELI